jgi:hypothetical protein
MTALARIVGLQKPRKLGPRPPKRIARNTKPIPRRVHVKRVSMKRGQVIAADKEWADRVKERDGGCVLGPLLQDCAGQQEAHHAFYTKKAHPRLRYVLENGAQLCHWHHHAFAHGERTLWRLWWGAKHPDWRRRVDAKAKRESRLS